LAFTTLSRAAEFRLVKGKQYELCRQLGENLKLFPELRINPQLRINQCEIPFDPRFSDFREIRWESLDPGRHMDVIREINMKKHDRAALLRRWKWGPEDEAREAALWERLKPEVEAMIAAGEVGLGRTRMDLNHDGKLDTVYRYGRFRCDVRYPEPHQSFAWTYSVLQRDDPDLNWALRGRAGFPYFAFYFEGRVYLARLPAAQEGFYVSEPTWVPQTHGLAMVTVCVFDSIEPGGNN
jgi:hypothetical protein